MQGGSFSFVSEQTLVGVVQLLWMLLLPIGLAIHIFLWRTKDFKRFIGAAVLLFSLPSFLWSYHVLPFDLLWPAEKRLYVTSTSEYKVEFTQYPVSDGYKTGLVITRADGKQAYFTINGDDPKWWIPKATTNVSRVYINSIGGRDCFVDTDSSFISVSHRTNFLTALDYK